MPQEIDVRDFSVSRVTRHKRAELQSLAAKTSGFLPGGQEVQVARLDPTTGNASVIVSLNAPPQQGNYVQRALEHVQNVGQVAGLAASQPVEYRPDPHAQKTSSGGVAVHLQQGYKGIPVFDATQTVRFAPDGAITTVLGRVETVDADVTPTPTLTVDQAVTRAAEHLAQPEESSLDQFDEPQDVVALELSDLQPQVTAAFAGDPTHATVLDAAPFEGSVQGSLTWFKHGDDLRLAWEVVLTLPGATSQFRVLVDSESGAILYSKELIRSLKARGNVYRLDGSSQREMTDFPAPWERHGIPVPPDLAGTDPPDWIDDSGQTQGNGVHAHLEDNGPAFAGQQQGSVLVLDPADPLGDDQKVLNTFYYCCLMHDFFYMLGFREQDGNFQVDNLGGGGLGGDPVDARAFRGPVRLTASMQTLADGTSPVMRLGLVTNTGRHTAFDATVIFHEFTHGVTNRLVGGRLNDRALEAPQSRGMGEGWGDYFACVLTNQAVVAAWVTNRPQGARVFRYDESFPAKTDNFGSLGTGRYTGEEHNLGEIWCATLMAMTREIGKTLAMQLVVDALKLSPANPGFIDMRDAILAALAGKRSAGQLSQVQHDTALNGIWKAFVNFGMGPKAASNGPHLSGIKPDFSPPPPVGVPSPPTGTTTAPATGAPAVPVMWAVEISQPAVRDVEIRIHFADETARDDFQTIFKGWLQSYQSRANQARLGLQRASAATSQATVRRLGMSMSETP